MTNLSQLPEDVLQGVARQIGGRLFTMFSSGDAEPSQPFDGEEPPSDFAPFGGITDVAMARFELGESFEVWRLRSNAVDEFVQDGEELVTLARPTGAWHHQIKVTTGEANEKSALAFARSVSIGGLGNERTIRDLFFSPLAAAMDEAILRADQKMGEDSLVVRLLSLAEHKIEALWFIAPQLPDAKEKAIKLSQFASEVMVVTAPESFHGPQTSFMSSKTFLHALVDVKMGMGFRV